MQLHWRNLLSKRQRCDTKEQKDYYKNDKERLKSKQEINTEIYLKKKKNKKRAYGRNNISEEKKQFYKKKEYQKNIKKTTARLKNWNKTFWLIFHCIKHGTRSCVFRRKWHH